MAPRLTLFTWVFLLAVCATVGVNSYFYLMTLGTGDSVSPYERTLVRGADATHLSHAAPMDKLASLERAIASLHRDVKMVQHDIAEAGRMRAERIEAERIEAARRAETRRVEAERIEAGRIEAARRAEARRVEAERMEDGRIEAGDIGAVGPAGADGVDGAAGPQGGHVKARACARLKLTYSVDPGTSWGSMNKTMQNLWATLQCDNGGTQSLEARTCVRLKLTYGVKPGTSWGDMNKTMQNLWATLQCDKGGIPTRSATDRRSDRDRRQSPALRAIFPMCPWMSRPRAVRYPRTVSRRELPSADLQCLRRLMEATDQHELLWRLSFGWLVSTLSQGGYHGNFDDGDADIYLAYSGSWAVTPKLVGDKYCKGGGVGARLLSFHGLANTEGHVVDTIGRTYTVDVDRRAVNATRESRLVAAFRSLDPTSLCVGEFEDMEVLTTQQTFAERQFGLSWWVPPVRRGEPGASGMKDVGGDHSFDWVTPLKETVGDFDEFHNWGMESLDNLRSWDTNSNGVLEVGEFLDCVLGRTEINSLWVNDMIARRACVVTNALEHWQNTMSLFQRFATARKRITQASPYEIQTGENMTTAQRRQFAAFRMTVKRPRYSNNHAQCRAMIPPLYVRAAEQQQQQQQQQQQEATSTNADTTTGAASSPLQQLEPWGYGWSSMRREISPEQIVAARMALGKGANESTPETILLSAIDAVEVFDQDGSHMLNEMELTAFEISTEKEWGGLFEGRKVDFGSLYAALKVNGGQ